MSNAPVTLDERLNPRHTRSTHIPTQNTGHFLSSRISSRSLCHRYRWSCRNMLRIIDFLTSYFMTALSICFRQNRLGFCFDFLGILKEESDGYGIDDIPTSKEPPGCLEIVEIGYGSLVDGEKTCLNCKSCCTANLCYQGQSTLSKFNIDMYSLTCRNTCRSAPATPLISLGTLSITLTLIQNGILAIGRLNTQRPTWYRWKPKLQRRKRRWKRGNNNANIHLDRYRWNRSEVEACLLRLYRSQWWTTGRTSNAEAHIWEYLN